jgi:hypothetical protein
LSDEEILDWLRETDREEILKDISGTELLSLVWNSSVKLADPAKLAGFLSTLKKEEESALSQLHSQSMPKGGLPEAVQALDVLEMKRVHNLLQRAQSQLKQPGIDAATIVKLNERVVALRKEYLDRRTRLQNIPKS